MTNIHRSQITSYLNHILLAVLARESWTVKSLTYYITTIDPLKRLLLIIWGDIQNRIENSASMTSKWRKIDEWTENLKNKLAVWNEDWNIDWSDIYYGYRCYEQGVPRRWSQRRSIERRNVRESFRFIVGGPGVGTRTIVPDEEEFGVSVVVV